MNQVRKIISILEFKIFQNSFSRRFEFYTTVTKDELNEIYHLRYQVYCEEYGYLEKNKYPKQLEYDEYDKHSVHFLLRSKKGEIAASVRIIFNSDIGFPIEKNFHFDVDIPKDQRSNIAEISRLIVAKKFRKKFLLLALIKGLFAYTTRNNISHVYSVLDDKLYPIVQSMGFPFKKIGRTAMYQGITTPYIMDIKDMMDQLKKDNLLLFRYIANGVIEYKDNGSYSIH